VVERHAYRQMETLGAPYPRSMRTVGGGAANPAWTQIRAQVLGVAMADPGQYRSCLRYGTAGP
jgi:sugar (pentulose or hexulose) kinase